MIHEAQQDEKIHLLIQFDLGWGLSVFIVNGARHYLLDVFFAFLQEKMRNSWVTFSEF